MHLLPQISRPSCSFLNFEARYTTLNKQLRSLHLQRTCCPGCQYSYSISTRQPTIKAIPQPASTALLLPQMPISTLKLQHATHNKQTRSPQLQHTSCPGCQYPPSNHSKKEQPAISIHAAHPLYSVPAAPDATASAVSRMGGWWYSCRRCCAAAWTAAAVSAAVEAG